MIGESFTDVLDDVIGKFEPNYVACYVLALGDPFNGITLIGPYNTFKEARADRERLYPDSRIVAVFTHKEIGE